MIRNPVGQAKQLKKTNKTKHTKNPHPKNILNIVKVKMSHTETEISERLNSKVKL